MRHKDAPSRDSLIDAAGKEGTERLTKWLRVGAMMAFLLIHSPARAAAGVEVWRQLCGNPGESSNVADHGFAVAIDEGSQIFVTGGSYSTALNMDYATIAYSIAGIPLWTNRFGVNSYDIATRIAADSHGHVIVTGWSTVNDSADWVTIAYSANNGSALWTNYYGGPAHGSDTPSGLVVDDSGNIFVTGVETAFTSSYYVTIAYSGAGVPLWTNRFNSQANGYASPNGIAVSSDGNIYVTGSVQGPSGRKDWATLACSGTGTALWTNYYNGPANSNDIANAVAVDRNSGTVFVTGLANDGDYYGSAFHIVTIAYSSAGIPLWTNLGAGDVIGSDSSVNRTVRMAVDADSNVIVGGTVRKSLLNGLLEILISKYSGDGVLIWTNRFGYTNDSSGIAGLGVDRHGNVFVTGSAFHDIITLASSASGVPLWTNRYDGPIKGLDYLEGVQTLAVTPTGEVVVVGSSESSINGTTNLDYAIIKYVSVPTLTGLTRIGSTAWQVSFSGMPGSQYITQFATNLTTSPWFSLSTNSPDSGGKWTLTDPNANSGQRFYRAVQY